MPIHGKLYQDPTASSDHLWVEGDTETVAVRAQYEHFATLLGPAEVRELVADLQTWLDEVDPKTENDEPAPDRRKTVLRLLHALTRSALIDSFPADGITTRRASAVIAGSLVTVVARYAAVYSSAVADWRWYTDGYRVRPDTWGDLADLVLAAGAE